MIALAITCLLVATVFVALISASDSLLRGWQAYRALSAELRTMSVPTGTCSLRKASARPAPRADIRRRRADSGIRAAA